MFLGKNLTPHGWLDWVIIKLFIFSTLFSLYAQQKFLPIKIDDFDYKHDWWEYRAIGSVKNDPNAFYFGKGFLKIQLKNPTKNRMCDVGISEHQGIYKKRIDWLEAEIRLKVLNPMKPGSRGWGFWRMRVAGRPSSLAWFMEQMGPFLEEKLTWEKAGVISNKGRAETPVEIAIDEWHTYRIVRNRKTRSTQFFIDDKPVLNASYYPIENLSFHCWIDNGVYSRAGVQFTGWQGVSALVIDYVKIKTLPQMFIPIVNDPPICFHQQYFEFGTSAVSQPWKTVSFISSGNQVWIFATARLEYDEQFAPTDQLLFQVDGKLLNAFSWDGEEIKNRMVTRGTQVKLSPGPHKLQLFSAQTPFLNEITVLEPDTVLVYRTNFEKTPEYTIQFSVKKFKPILIYVSGNARETPGWNHVRPDSRDEAADGDIRFYLDEKPLPQVICGNQVFGNGQSYLIRKPFALGVHTFTVKINGNAVLNTLFIAQ